MINVRYATSTCQVKEDDIAKGDDLVTSSRKYGQRFARFVEVMVRLWSVSLSVHLTMRKGPEQRGVAIVALTADGRIHIYGFEDIALRAWA
jgi:hypothetical protein